MTFANVPRTNPVPQTRCPRCNTLQASIVCSFCKTDKRIEAVPTIPAAACPRCGGWTNCGGMAQFYNNTTPVLGRVGCTCNK